jgi:hypothetical protein
MSRPSASSARSRCRTGRWACGQRNIAAAWFTNPTARYRHFALGAEHEAETLVVSTPDRRGVSAVPASRPRIVVVDGDSRDEVMVVRSYLKVRHHHRGAPAAGGRPAVAVGLNGGLSVVIEP